MKATSGRIEALLMAAPIFDFKSAMGDGVCLTTSFSRVKPSFEIKITSLPAAGPE